MRPSAVGKKNFLFAGHPSAGWRSAVLYSVLGTCALVRANPWKYLTWVLPKLAAATTQTDPAALTPQRIVELTS